MIFSVLTLNMQNGQPWNDSDPDACEIDLEKTVTFLLEQDADVVFLQEVEQGFDGGEQVEPPPNYSRLREALKGYDSVFGYPPKNACEIPFGLGLAIFSKSKLRDVGRIELPAADVGFEFAGKPRKPSERLLLGASTVIDGRSLRLLNTHLQAYFMIGTTSDEHRAQRDCVEAELRAQSGPALLAGDFNCPPGEGLVAQFEAAGFRPVQTAEVTWRRKPFVLDHIFFNGALRLEAQRVISTDASDHHAVRAEFSFAG
ncbi:MAG: endonuclease/exonuclease/phosphatase family protein [Terrimicrobiaceae bacterium]|nr:endonuclease/exonuclease/phosphatase family protein [Terrimicrobiaceae bacterium]